MSASGWKRRWRQRLSRTLRPLEARLRKRMLLAVDRCVLLFPAAPDPRRVLLVRLDNIGDFVLWLDAGETIARHYRSQGKRVTLLANAVWSGWAAEMGIFDEVLSLEEKRFRQDLRYRFRMGRTVRALGCGTALQPAATRVLALGDSLLRLSGATECVGPEGGFDCQATGDRATGDAWYTKLLPIDPVPHGEMRRNAAFVRALTGSGYRAKVSDLRPYLATELPRELSAELAGRPYFVLFPGATFSGRLWPAERYAALANRLVTETGWVGVICGGPSEAGQAARLCAEAEVPLLNWVGRTKLAELARVRASAELLLANETSAVHIAAAVGLPTVCLLGGGHYDRFMPYDVEERDARPLPVAVAQPMPCFHCDWKCVYHPPKGTPVPCIEEVSTAAAWQAVEQVLASDLAMAEASHSVVQIAGLPRLPKRVKEGHMTRVWAGTATL